MIEKYFSVEQISKMLSIHPKTIQRYIREGKLRASKIGKSWRITGHDLSVFTENEKNIISINEEDLRPPINERISVSAVVDILVYNKDNAINVMNMLTGAMNSKPPEYGNASMQSQYIPQENKIRITLWGGLNFIEVMMNSISILTDKLE